ncbi:putative toxin MIT1-like [Scophthalmus maximus]|uniref:Prokineticin 2 n=1 Tax=Scophthalmus maximus TaxID=52904 RepID=A0A2U9BHI2_SCOMX|nr:prokineticin-2 [Scophthalmus maximus]AWP03381.1 putative toxin MIT1-like [Scophthalmus maximus]
MSLEATCLCGLSRMHMQQGPAASASSLLALAGTGAQGKLSIMRSFFLLLFSLLLVSHGSSAVITGACEKDSQCGGGMCCAVSLWIGSLRMCTAMGQEGDDCHPMSHKVPFFGKRIHHTCPCLPNLSCITVQEGRSKCLSPYQYPDYYL